MEQPDSKNRESLKIDFKGLKKRLRAKEITVEDFADFALIGSQYAQALSVGIWLTFLQEQSKITLLGGIIFSLISFYLSLRFRWISNKLRREP